MIAERNTQDGANKIVANDSGVSISKGAPVYFDSGGDAAAARANAASTAGVVGIARHLSTFGSTLSIRTNGYVLIPTAQQTGTWASGDRVYLDPATAGKITNVKPTTIGQFVAPLGIVQETDGGEATLHIQIGPVELITAGDAEQTLTDQATIAYDVSLGRNANVTITATRVLNFTNPVAGQSGVLRVIQGGAGSFELTYTLGGVGADVDLPAAVAPALTDAAGSVDLLNWYYDGTVIHLTPRGLDSRSS